ncbi:MAG: META domain-containing protein [Halomonas sp.]|jgi:heat shock protein HslJ|uniref:META domain-containing protein n=1 Tax=Billgrantia tianxiuensis TaxID=2497861 RepID=A0A6I6SM78_9GAMM|nr:MULTISPECIES: META domain-containing protein [Halomonas]MCE8033237.1 META domain-containing protein [Halomonas sp. MCCC 1A11057]MDX5433741.1 META domain-containing protein [Halomonas sp.]QHC48980.1 META domain-containing protein [Halomonas tianxiuensis]
MKKRFAILLSSLAIVLMGCTAMEGSMTHDESLVNTYWKLTQVGDVTPVAVDNQREAHFVLHTEENRVAGSTGCNRLAGNYRLESNALHFGPLITTRMACLQGGETERAFLAALEATATWQVEGQTLTLRDASGTAVAQFEAVHLN